MANKNPVFDILIYQYTKTKTAFTQPVRGIGAQKPMETLGYIYKAYLRVFPGGERGG